MLAKVVATEYSINIDLDFSLASYNSLKYYFAVQNVIQDNKNDVPEEKES